MFIAKKSTIDAFNNVTTLRERVAVASKRKAFELTSASVASDQIARATA